MNYIIPPINLVGQFKLKQPLTPLINNNITYTVTNIQTIPNLLSDDIDAEQLIYIDQGLTTEDYNNALVNNIPIITLTTEGDSVFNIPSNYIENIPQVVGKVFINKALLVNLDYLPDDINIDFIKDEVNDLIATLIGITPTSEIEEISGKYIASYEEADVFEAKRLANISNNKTCRSKLKEVNKTLQDYKDKNKILIKKIENI